MKFFLINLEHDTVKLAAVKAQLKQRGVVFERFPAIYGKDMSDNDRRRSFSSFRWWCAIGRPIMAAEIGCALSHYAIYKRMLDERIPFAFILEDDVVVASEFNKVLNRVEGWLDKDKPQVVVFSNHGNIDFSRLVPNFEFPDGVKIFKTPSGTCTESYCLTLPAAEALLEQNLPMITPCDHWGRWVKNGAIELYHALPTTCSQNQAEFGSSTSQGRGTSVDDYSLPRWVAHKSKRVVGKLIDKILIQVTHR